MQLTRAGLVDIKSFIIIWIHTHTHFNVRIFGFGLLCTHFKRSIVVWKEKRLWIFSVCFLCKRKELIWRKYSNNRANSVVFRYPIRIFEWRAISRQIPFNVKFIVRKQPDTFSNQVIFEPPVLNKKKMTQKFQWYRHLHKIPLRTKSIYVDVISFVVDWTRTFQRRCVPLWPCWKFHGDNNNIWFWNCTK